MGEMHVQEHVSHVWREHTLTGIAPHAGLSHFLQSLLMIPNN